MTHYSLYGFHMDIRLIIHLIDIDMTHYSPDGVHTNLWHLLEKSTWGVLLHSTSLPSVSRATAAHAVTDNAASEPHFQKVLFYDLLLGHTDFPTDDEHW